MKKKFSKPHLSRVINGDIEIVEKPKNPDLIRLDLRLAELYPEYTRGDLAKFIRNGSVSVDGEAIRKPSALVEKEAAPILTPVDPIEKPNLPVIFEDENVLVLDKPAGLLSMSKGPANPEPTLEDYGILVHRLDRDTSGVVILAKNEEARSFLQKQFQNRTAHKTYFAITSGTPKLEAALIDLPIARSLKAPTTFVVDASGREAKTEYRVAKSDERHSLIELKPKTGRTHQLRVHLAYLNAPILGDPVYGVEKAKRMYLHANSLELTLPGGTRKTFTSPLPEDFADVLR